MSTKISVKATKIQLIRKLLNMDYGEFGQECGYNPVTIHMVENGKRSVTDELCKSVCKAFDVNEKWLQDDADLTGIDGSEETSIDHIFRKFYVEDGVMYPRKALIPALQSKRIREVFENSHLIQRDFCKETGWTLSNLQDMLNAKRKLSYRYAERLEKRFGVGTDWLLYGDESSKDDPCNEEMINFLKNQPEIRKIIKQMMNDIPEWESGKISCSDIDRFLSDSRD